MPHKEDRYIFRRCITLKNGKRICMPEGRAFRIPIRSERAR